MNFAIASIDLHPYQMPLTDGGTRFGAFLHVIGNQKSGWGDIAPLPKRSQETLEEALGQLCQKKDEIMRVDWTAESCSEELAKLGLLPSVSFGLESALLSMLAQIPAYAVSESALFMGTPEEIFEQARLRSGFTSAKLKVSQLSFAEAARVIRQLKDQFRLRIDVNRAWNTPDSLRFFSQFPFDAFDYVEEPFQNPQDLAQFSHPLAVDESFPQDLSLAQLESLPTLKALIYKPTIQGGMLGALPLYEWAVKRGVSLVLSSSFESSLGLAHIASMARRMSLTAPIGIGTYHFSGLARFDETSRLLIGVEAHSRKLLLEGRG